MLAPLFVASPNKIQSSANKRWETCGPFLLTVTPLKVPLFIVCLNKLDKPLPHERNKNELSGPPCLKPLDGVNLTPLCPLITVEYETIETHFMIAFTQLRSNPSLS